jgi:hypothetical protein
MAVVVAGVGLRWRDLRVVVVAGQGGRGAAAPAAGARRAVGGHLGVTRAGWTDPGCGLVAAALAAQR